MLPLIIVLYLLGSPSQGPPQAHSSVECPGWALSSLPDSFAAWFRASRLAKTHVITCYLNPYYLRGDFDGDGSVDLAILMMERASKKRGILIVHQAGMAPHLLGAGVPVGNGGDDFRWLGYWRVEPAPRVANAFNDPLPRFWGEVLYVAKPEAASAWIGWNGRRYVWYQAGD